MYWVLVLLSEMSKKWKVSPIWLSAGKAQNTALDMARARRGIGVAAVI